MLILAIHYEYFNTCSTMNVPELKLKKAYFRFSKNLPRKRAETNLILDRFSPQQVWYHFCQNHGKFPFKKGQHRNYMFN